MAPERVHPLEQEEQSGEHQRHRPGDLVRDNVRLLVPLAEGGMGTVWLADHLTLLTKVAVKLISAPAEASDESLQRFSQEARISAEMKSPHVVQVFDHGVSALGAPFIIMELLEGEDLCERLELQGVLGVEETGKILTQLAKVLGKAHKLGIVHRDIKPDNIYLCNTDEGAIVKVFDFGIAKDTRLPAVDRLTRRGHTIGTPEFMSPEQIGSAADVDSRADVWAMAVVAYYALTGTTPFRAPSLGMLVAKMMSRTYPRLSELRPELPATLDGFFSKAFALDIDERFASARELAQSLLSFVPFGDDFDEYSYSGEFVPPILSLPPKPTSDPVSQERPRLAPPAPERELRGDTPHPEPAETLAVPGAPAAASPAPRTLRLVVAVAVLAAIGGAIVVWLARRFLFE